MTRRDPSAAQRLAALLDASSPGVSLGRPGPGRSAPELTIEVHPDPETPLRTRQRRVVESEPAGELGSGWDGRVRALAARWLPESWRGARLDPGRPGAAALALVTAAAAVVAAIGVWTQRPRAEPIDALPTVSVTTVAPETTSASPPGELVVSVVGQVARPGLVRVPDGARVADVLAAAGDALPGADLATVNLARRVADGEQVAVGVPAAADTPVSDSAGAATATSPAGPIDLNSATVAQLDGLPGVGPITAQRIVEWRNRNGRFARLDQLREIEGIGERRFAQLRELVRI